MQEKHRATPDDKDRGGVRISKDHRWKTIKASMAESVEALFNRLISIPTNPNIHGVEVL